MNKANKVMPTIIVGTIGILALGACSSVSDQAQGGRDAAPGAAAASPKNATTMPPLKSKMFQDVTVTHGNPAKCSRNEDGDSLVIECYDVWDNGDIGIGDQVFIRVPTKHYRIDVQKDAQRSHVDPMTTVQRDWLYFPMHWSTDSHTVWNWPYKRQDQTGVPWGVGINGTEYGSVAFKAVVTLV